MQDLSKTIEDMTTTNQHSTQPEHFLLMSNSPSAVINSLQKQLPEGVFAIPKTHSWEIQRQEI